MNKEKLTLSIDKMKADELLEKLSRAHELILELEDILDSIKHIEGLFKA